MFDFDAGKLLIIGVVALIVIGPKDLPRVMRQVGQAVSKLRRMAAEFQSQFMEAMREAELEDIRKDMEKIGEQATAQSTFNPIETVRRELTEALADRSLQESPPGPSLALDGLEEAAEEGPALPAAATAPIAEVPDQAPESASPEPLETSARDGSRETAGGEPLPGSIRSMTAP